jgi:hypothetical protein
VYQGFRVKINGSVVQVNTPDGKTVYARLEPNGEIILPSGRRVARPANAEAEVDLRKRRRWFNGHSLTIDDLLKKSRPGRKTKGRTVQRIIDGNYEQALSDFFAMQLDNIVEIPNVGFRGEYLDGRTVIVRERSTYGRPTIEIPKSPGSKKKFEFRYVED